MNNNFYVYRHIRLDTNTPFYVGKGKGKRAYSKQRNNYWHRIVNKHGYIVEIFEENLTEDQAFEKEIESIKLYKSQGYCETNFTGGGEGPSGAIRSEETCKKISKANKGKKLSEETRKKISEAAKGRKHSEEAKKRMRITNSGKNNGMYGKTHTAEVKEKMSEAHKGKESGNKGNKYSEESRKKISIAAKKRLSDPTKNGMYGKKHSPESIEKMKEAQSGEKSWMYGKRGEDCHNYGKKHSEETKAKMSAQRKGKCTIPPMPGKLNPRWKGYCFTPHGIFETYKYAAKSLKMAHKTIKNRCDSPEYKDWYIKKELK